VDHHLNCITHISEVWECFDSAAEVESGSFQLWWCSVLYGACLHSAAFERKGHLLMGIVLVGAPG